jgi:hypothetical protein
MIELVYLRGQGGQIAGVALEHRDGDRAPLGRAQQSGDDLQDNNPALTP